MNVCFIIWKIISEIEYRFMVNGRDKAIVQMWLETNNGNKIYVTGYNEIADKVYSGCCKGDFVIFYGKVECERIVIKNLEKMVS